VVKPRIFISSTFYNLKQVRADLEAFVKSLGYDPVLNERGAVPYGNDQRLEEYCYKEIDLCDIVVAIIGGRFGSASQHEPYSISQMELKTAVELGKPLYIFVEQAVLSEFRTYHKNIGNESIMYAFVDDIRVYHFLDEMEKLPKNNPVAGFTSVQDIMHYLKEQWAGLFQRFLQERELMKQINIVKDMQLTVDTLNQLVSYLSQEKKGSDETIKLILTQNHPIFSRIGKVTNAPYRVFFTNREEMKRWLRARNWNYRSDDWEPEQEWVLETPKITRILTIDIANIFDGNDNLKVIAPDDWEDEWVTVVDQKPAANLDDLDDEIPF
jgi:nucleoside 2-deoxyribosyltransferase